MTCGPRFLVTMILGRGNSVLLRWEETPVRRCIEDWMYEDANNSLEGMLNVQSWSALSLKERPKKNSTVR